MIKLLNNEGKYVQVEDEEMPMIAKRRELSKITKEGEKDGENV